MGYNEMSEFTTVRGMRDFLPEEADMMKYIEDEARKTAKLYGYKEIITPIVESYELLSAKAGEEVRSRMFIFKDLGGRDVALRPEFTASVARLVATTLKNEPSPHRLFCTGSVYRYDEPQRGRYREFWQSNFELMGSDKPEADAEIILLTDSLARRIGLKNCAIKIGHVGVLRGIFDQEKLGDKTQNTIMQLMDKTQYEDALKIIQESNVSKKCVSTIQELIGLKGSNILQVADKIKECIKNYDKAVEAAENLQTILELVKENSPKAKLTVDAGFARGLEYYTGIIFELNVPELTIALGGGGRYDRLIELFGGEPTPAMGVAHGIDRIMLTMHEQKTKPSTKEERSVTIIPISEQLRSGALKISSLLREAGIPVEVEVMGRKITKALEDSDRRRMDYAIILGEKELKQEAVVLRDLKKREQSVVKIRKLVETITNQKTA